jgi:transposase
MDIGDRQTVIVVMDADGKVTSRIQVETKTAKLEAYFSNRTACRVMLEVGTHSPWIWRLLCRLGYEAIVLNPRRIRLIAESTRKHDLADAVILADLGRMGMSGIRRIVHREEQEQADLEVLRARSCLIGERTRLVNHVRGVLKSTGLRPPSCDARAAARILRPHVPESMAPALLPLVESIQGLTDRIRQYDLEVERLIRERYEDALVLQTMTGVGPITSLTYVLTVGDPTRFASSRQLGPYLGLVPRLRQSGERSREQRISKEGDRQVRALLVQSAHYILAHEAADSDLRRWALKKVGSSKGSKKRAAVALARKLAVVLHRLWVSGEPFEPFRQRETSAAEQAA